ncbi:Eco57I restriction-modification methylase domain-containing protein [Dyadobacter jiangsuensis]|uniref:site-specific DNA-methyltransferase (adenine-specific) n=1 Tax=Dyadobacter jiangsuensis TaxID=1591085 RepID=A0A2P8G7X9_9BACT|nr:hypothetical protein [Dyadobacter jiangsuensis]PSL30083.1 hypothetical protein CLV60_10425 [Dyadobacter jiangsuensis]
MIHFIQNIGEYFASNYFDEDFSKKVIEKSGYGSDAIKELGQAIAKLKPEYFKLKQKFIENHLRTKDKINLSHGFHSLMLTALGYDAGNTQYHELFPINDKNVLPVRHILYRGSEIHLMVLEMHALIKTKDQDNPDGLFEQSYNVEHDEDIIAKAQKYHRSQWADIFTVPDGQSISPLIINKAINELFLLPTHRRPKYILLCGGNQYFLLECEKWFRGSYLQLDLEAVFDDASSQKDSYAVFHLLLGKDLLAPTAEMILIEQLDEDAHKAAYEVTKDLKEGVIHAVENLANETVKYLKGQGIDYHEIDASLLKSDCLNMVYRLLFLFYAEAREDLDILPSNDDVYERGYSLEMLRDLEQVPLVTESSINGYFFHESLFRLFQLLNNGYREDDGVNKSFKIRHLDSPMFDAGELHYLNKVKIRNIVWQDVICELSLSKQQRGKTRGRISYANLGINQLGSVYESLLAFRGFLAETDYIEVHRKKKKGETSEKVVRSDGSYLVPRHRLDDFEKDEIYYTEKEEAQDELKVIPQGDFIYRLSGRDRQKSASYYTPEVLTQTTVKYTLKPILERLDKGELKASALLKLKILEPAMGAAAFHNEVINQLAQAYLTYRQEELKQRVDPNHYQEELQKIKAYIALNNVYGVDLNPTAVELGKLSLWLNVIHKDMQTPFFGYRLGVGNAVVGSWLKVFKHKDFSFVPKGNSGAYEKKEWWNRAPQHLKFGKKGILRKEDEIYHFLLPDIGMASSAGIKLLKDTYPKETKAVSDWRRGFCKPIDGDEFKKLQQISRAIDALLLEHYEIQRNIGLITEANTVFFGNENTELQLNFQGYSYEQKEKFARERLKPNAPYYKLKQIMDYWCSLWFWDVRAAADLPTRQQWHEDLMQVLNIDLSVEPHTELTDEEVSREYRKDKKQLEKQLVEALKQSSSSLFTNQRAVLVKQYADQYRFFHYELEFIEVFRENNGFDIAVGNPPWVNITFDETGVLSEVYPEVYVKGYSAPQVKKFGLKVVSEEEYLLRIYLEENIEANCTKQFLKSIQNYPLLNGQRNNLYKCVISNGLNWINKNGFLGLIHPEGIYDDPDGYELRKELYKRLKYHFHFRNSLFLFPEVHDQQTYSINVYSGNEDTIDVINIFNLFHPSTIDGCFIPSQTSESIGIKLKTFKGFEWNLKSSPERLIKITKIELRLLAKTFENSTNYDGAKLVSIHSKDLLSVYQKLKSVKTCVKDFDHKITDCWNETTSVNDGTIRRETKYPKIEDYEMIFSGPHIFVGNPMYKSPKKVCLLNSDYDVISLEETAEHFNSRTNYIPLKVNMVSSIKGIENKDGSFGSWSQEFRLLFRRRLNQASERTLCGALIPPYTSHVNTTISVYFLHQEYTLELSALSSSLIFDFYIKTIGKPDLYDDTISNFPLGIDKIFLPPLNLRSLLLNSLSVNYKQLWESSYDEKFADDSWSVADPRLPSFDTREKEWNWAIPLRSHFARRMALVEIDVISAMAFKLTLKELISIYQIYFDVLQQNEDDTWYDSRGNIVFTRAAGLIGVGLDRSDWEKIMDMQEGEITHTITKSELYQGQQVVYHAPFTKCDRVEDYKRAWVHFEKRFNTSEGAAGIDARAVDLA